MRLDTSRLFAFEPAANVPGQGQDNLMVKGGERR
jgi:hypothetical protein